MRPPPGNVLLVFQLISLSLVSCIIGQERELVSGRGGRGGAAGPSSSPSAPFPGVSLALAGLGLRGLFKGSPPAGIFQRCKGGRPSVRALTRAASLYLAGDDRQ